MKYITLDKENFFNEIEKVYPSACKLFCDWIDDFKKSVNWNELFNQDNSVGGNPVDKPKAPKFHEIPFLMQKGIMEHFFLLNNILIIFEPHPTQRGYTWTIVYLEEEGYATKPYFDGNGIDIINYASADACIADAFKTAFKILNESFAENEKEN